MYLKKITLNNYRCFEHLTLDLHPRLTVIVGTNGAGKTTLLDGIATGMQPLFANLSTANQRLKSPGIDDTDFRIVMTKDKAGQTRQTLADYTQVIVQAEGDLSWDYWRPSVRGKEPQQKVGSLHLKQRIAELHDRFSTGDADFFPVLAYYGTLRGQLEIPGRLHSSQVNYSYPTSALIGALDAGVDFKEILKWFDLAETEELRLNRGVSNDDYNTLPTLDTVREAITQILGGEYCNPHFNRDHKLVVEHAETGRLLQVNQLSQGYQSMLALAMDVARRMALANQHLVADMETLQSLILDLPVQRKYALTDEPEPEATTSLLQYAPALVLIDEIDLHLHPSWQQRVLSDLMRAFPLAQFIVTTHSPQVLSTVAGEHIRVLYQDDEGNYHASKPDFSPLAHESGDALARVMGTHKLPPLPLQEKVREYETLVRSGQEYDSACVQLKQELDAIGYQPLESELAAWRFLASYKKGQTNG